MEQEEVLVLDYRHYKINISNGCDHCPLKVELNDGMNITEICKYDNHLIIFKEKRCGLSKEEKEEVDGKTLVETIYIEN